jgi:predicted NBD/HSP70 family sugar kinase
MRQLNSALVLRAIRDAGPTTRAEIRRATGLSKPTVHEVVDALLRSGYVSESAAGDGARRPGPPARVLTFRADLGHVLGVDVGANKLLVLVADLAGDVVASERRRTDGPDSADAVLAEVSDMVDAALARAGVSRNALKAAGIGTPGVVDPDSGTITLAPQLRGWEGINLAERLGRSFSCPVLVENEAHLSVLAERERGAAVGVDDAVCIQIGVGIGAGILSGGTLYRGADGAAGEIGYLPFADGDGESAPDGFGPFEHAAGGGAFARLGARAAAAPEGSLLRRLAGGDPRAVDAAVVFEAARRGDESAQAVLAELVTRLARGIACVVTVLNPATVIIGGGLSRAGALLLDPLQERVAALVPVAPPLVLSTLGDESAALGAIHLALRSVEERLFSFVEEAG